MEKTLKRFFDKVDVGDCWQWVASKTSDGYGQFFPGDGKRWRSHRWLWTQLVGPIASGLEVDHLCRNRACVNPDHLEPVSKKVNQHRGNSPMGVNARKTQCPAGHIYDEANTRLSVDKFGTTHRQCRACDRIKWHKRSKKNRKGLSDE